MIIPAPQIAGITGWKIAVIAPNTRFTKDTFSSLFAFTVSEKLPIFFISSHTCDTSDPITTWNWPFLFTTPCTPFTFSKDSTSTLDTFFNVNLKRVIQFVTDSIFSVPPIFFTTSLAIVSYLFIISS